MEPHNQHAARHQVRDDHTQPEVRAEIQVHVLLHNGGVVHVAAVDLQTCTITPRRPCKQPVCLTHRQLPTVTLRMGHSVSHADIVTRRLLVI